MALDKDGKEIPGTSGRSGAEDDKGDRRKIAGKYSSTEEAIEAIAKHQDEMFHETRGEMGAIKQLLERVVTTPIGSRGDDDDGYDDRRDRGGYRRGRDEDENDPIDATEFLTSPGKILSRREARLAKQMEERSARRTASMISNATTVLRFQMQNPDLDEHENLVQSYFRETNPNDSVAKRLRDAAKLTKAYLAKVKGKGGDDDDNGAGRNPNSDEHIDDSTKERREANQHQTEERQQQQSADDELMAEIQERRKFKGSRFASPQK